MMGFTTESTIKTLYGKFTCISGYKDKIASFVTNNGRELAIQTKPTTGIYMWFEKYNSDILGIEVRNREYPGMPYSANQNRSSALNDTNAPKLKKGNQAWYLKFNTQKSLDEFIAWYEFH